MGTICKNMDNLKLYTVCGQYGLNVSHIPCLPYQTHLIEVYKNIKINDVDLIFHLIYCTTPDLV